MCSKLQSLIQLAATSLHSQSDDSDPLGVQYHSPPPTSLDESEDEGEQEEEEEEVRTCFMCLR